MVCGQPEGDPCFETDPRLLIEVLSPGTANIDRREKYAACTSLPSLQTYLIVAQDERRVHVYQRGSGTWALRELIGRGELILPCLGHTLSVDEVYRGGPTS